LVLKKLNEMEAGRIGHTNGRKQKAGNEPWGVKSLRGDSGIIRRKFKVQDNAVFCFVTIGDGFRCECQNPLACGAAGKIAFCDRFSPFSSLI
jgi:hypothetical protein